MDNEAGDHAILATPQSPAEAMQLATVTHMVRWHGPCESRGMRFAASPLRLAVFSSALAAASLFACSSNPAVEEDTGAVEEDDANDIFAKPEAFTVRLSAPLSKLFARYKAGEADPPKADAAPPVGWAEPDFSEPAKLVFTVDGAEKSVDLRVFVRGESSKDDCPFTKLKLDFDDKDQLKNTPFKGHGKMRLNTHCGPGDASARSGMGRVFNGVGPVREELTYRLVRAASIPTYGTRVVAIHYDDTADKSQLDTFGMLVESGDDAAQRFVKSKLIDPKSEYIDPNDAFAMRITPENTAQIMIAESFSGNKDWGGTHNIDSFGVPKAATGFQIAQDFDLGAIVLGDIARYWKGNAPVSDAKASLSNATVAASIRKQKGAMEAAYAEAEKAMIDAKAIASKDGKTTTDPGFLEAKKRIQDLFELPELKIGAAPAAGDAGVAGDAGACTGAALDKSGVCRLPNGAFAAAACCPK